MRKSVISMAVLFVFCLAMVCDSGAGTISNQAKTKVQNQVPPKKVVSNLPQSSSISLIHKIGTMGKCTRYPSDEKKSGHYYLQFSDSWGTSAVEYLGRDHAKGDDCPQHSDLLMADGNVKEGILVLRTRRVNPMNMPTEYKWHMIAYNRHHITSDLLGLHPRYPNWSDPCNSESSQILHIQGYENYFLMVEEGSRATRCVQDEEGYLSKDDVDSLRITLYKYRSSSDYFFKGDYIIDKPIKSYLYERAIEKLFIYNGKIGDTPDRPLLVIKDPDQYKALKEARVDAKVVKNRFVVTFTGGNKSQSFYLKTPLK